MLQKLRSRSGQAVTGEYALAFFIAVVACSAMSVYVRRALQARIASANARAINAAQTVLGRPVPREYEPYYVLSARAQEARGSFRVQGNRLQVQSQATDSRRLAAESIQLPPAAAN